MLCLNTGLVPKEENNTATRSGLVNVLFVLPNCFLRCYTTVEVPCSDKRIVRVENLGKSQGDLISLPEPMCSALWVC